MPQVKTGFYSELAAVMDANPEKVLLSHGTRELRATEVRAEVERWASALYQQGARHGDRIAVQAPKSLELVFLYLASLRLGLIYLPLNSGYTAAELDYFLADAEPALFICEPQDVEKLSTLCRDRAIQLLGLDAGGHGSLRDAVSAASGEAPVPELADDDLAAIVYTSGTTGRSKGAMITHRNLATNARALVQTWGLTPSDMLLHALPLFHIHGLFVALNSMLLAGGRCEFLPAFNPVEVVAKLPDATLFMGVPTYYTRLLAEPSFTAQTAENVRLFVSGSAPLTPASFNEFKERTGQQILERYGMSECGIICSNPLDGERIPGAVGKPLPGIDVRISDGAPVGVLEVRGPNVCRGYWRQPEKTRAEFKDDGFFITGDVASIDEDGIVRIVGRDKDMIISGGLNIYPKEIETLIDEFEEVEESAVIAVPHSDFGEAVAAVIKLNPGAELNEAAVRTRLRGMLAAFKIPKAVFFTAELPRNTMGKVQKAKLREMHRRHFDK